ncbi:MAG: peptidylprolyl isomerase, partial [Candidatus Beckwithbacteria bacterium]|nr:peptidylprolyl isomerase [Candidatus Beckwithbacteria bacterium]
MMKSLIATVLVLILLLVSYYLFKPKTKETIQYSQAETVIEAGKTYSATLHTSAGDITIKLDSINTPNTANNFVFLAQKGFYDKTIFHRVLSGFMIQGGDPLGNGTGGPGYKFNDEPVKGKYQRGTVAMANSGPNTNGSQFFIVHADYDLPQNYVIFGQVTSGLDVVDKIATAPVTTGSGGEPSQPLQPVMTNSVSVIVK